ncbi:MAG: hypothetical protein RLZZ623_697 [Actinomycetota bacterium]|jgi:uncharacterized cupredoxin-like copper-binding protein
MRHLALIPVTILAATLAAACGSDPPNVSAGPGKVELGDYSITMPTTFEGPVVSLDIANLGTFAHELDLAQVEPGTTLEEAAALFENDHPQGGVLIADPGGATAIGPGADFGYTRTLTPGTYVFSCHFPATDGMNHMQHGMIAMFTVTDGKKSDLPKADLTITLGDDAITVPPLTAGTHVVAVTNIGEVPHEMNTGGVPIGTDLSRGEEVGAWMEGGQVGPPPIPVEFPGGLKSIAPGVTVVLTLTLKAAHTYMFSDDTNGLMALVDVP